MLKRTCVLGVALCCLSITGTSYLKAQVAPNAWIQTDGWNFLFPLQNPAGAAPAATLMKESWVAPHEIGTEDPKSATVWADIDFGGASPSTGHGYGSVAPNPTWYTTGLLETATSGTFPNGDLVDYQAGFVDVINALAAPPSPLWPGDNVLGIATTYVENVTGSFLPINVCTASDDSIQVWINNKCVANVSAARGSAGDCQERNPAFLPPGISKIATLVWEGGGGHNFRIALEDLDGTKLAEGNGLVNFLGAGVGNAAAVGQIQYCLTRSIDLDAFNCPPTEPVTVTLSGMGPGDDADALTVTETVSGSDVAISNVSSGGEVSPVVNEDDGIHPDTGAALEFFVVGPIANAGGAAPGLDAIRAEYLEIADSDVSTLDEGDMVDDIDGTTHTVRRIGVNSGDALSYDLVGGAGDNIMHYAWTQLTLSAPADVAFAAHADDSVQVLVNGAEVTIHNGGQGFGAQGEREWSGLASLPAGTHTILTKTFEGGGGHGVRLLFFDIPDMGIGAGGSDCASATTIAPGETGVGSTSGGAIGTGCDPQVSPAVYYQVTGTGAMMRAETCNPVFLYDTYLAVFTGDCVTPACVGSNDDTCSRQSVVEWASTAGETYFIRVYGWDDRKGVYFLRVSDAGTPAAAPIVATPLTGQGVCADPDGDCDPDALITSGQQITWDVTRGELNDTGVQYDVFSAAGATSHRGVVEGEAVADGPSSINYAAGPFGIFERAHDIGVPPTPGSTVYDAGADTYTISGSGADIWDGGDQFHFAYTVVEGDFDAICRVASRSAPIPGTTWGRTGLMARWTCDASSKYSMGTVSSSEAPYEATHQWRVVHLVNGNTRNGTHVASEAFFPTEGRRPTWQRIVRKGNAVYTYMSEDDGAGNPAGWIFLGSDNHIGAPDSMLVGYAVSSHNAAGTNLDTVVLDNVSIEPLGDGPDPDTCTASGELLAYAYDGEGDGAPPEDGTVVVGGGTFTPQVQSGRLRLTQDGIGSSATAVWYGLDPVAASDGFAAEFDVFMDATGTGAGCDPAANPDPADGMTFAVVEVAGTGDPFGAFPVDLGLATLVGAGGGAIGYDAGTLRERSESHPSFAIELDNWVGGGEPGNEPADGGAPGSDCNWHAGLDVNGSVSSLQTNVDFGVATGDLPNIYSPDGIHVEVFYTVDDSGPLALARIDVYATSNDGSTPRTKVLSTVIPALVGDVVLGFTAGTGGATTTQEIDNFVVSSCGEPPDGVGPFLRGDTDLSGDLNLTDAVRIFNWLFLGGPAPACLATANTNGESGAGSPPNLTSGVSLLNFLFLGGPQPISPAYPNCETSNLAGDVALGCETPLDCP